MSAPCKFRVSEENEKRYMKSINDSSKHSAVVHAAKRSKSQFARKVDWLK